MVPFVILMLTAFGFTTVQGFAETTPKHAQSSQEKTHSADSDEDDEDMETDDDVIILEEDVDREEG